MDKTAKELIQKMATLNPVKALKDHTRKSIAQGAAGGLAAGALFGVGASALASKKDDKKSEKKASVDMKSIIDDIIKGAEQNSFGRPVSIQTNTEWTHFDTAKAAGALQALGEQGYSVKEASEYLGLTEAQVQDILVAVR